LKLARFAIHFARPHRIERIPCRPWRCDQLRLRQKGHRDAKHHEPLRFSITCEPFQHQTNSTPAQSGGSPPVRNGPPPAEEQANIDSHAKASCPSWHGPLAHGACTHARPMVLHRHSTSGAFFASNVNIAPFALDRQVTADVEGYLHHGPEAPCHMIATCKF
jgi:hypothetical protein